MQSLNKNLIFTFYLLLAPLLVFGTSEYLNGNSNIPIYIETTTSNIGVGSSTPWGVLSVHNNCTAAPCFVVAQDTGNETGLTVFATTSLQGFGNGWRIGVATTTRGEAGLLDTLFVDGIINSSHRHVRCDTPNVIAATVSADLLGACGDFSFNEEVDGDMVMDNIGQPFGRLQAGSSVAINDGASLMVTGFAAASSSPTFEASIKLIPNTSAPLAVVGFATTTDFVKTVSYARAALQNGTQYPLFGAYFLASSSLTNNWFAVVSNGAGLQTIVDTGIAASSTTKDEYQTLRIEMTPTNARFYINGKQVKNITTNIPSHTLTPRVTVSVPNAAGTARALDVNYIRAWAYSP